MGAGLFAGGIRVPGCGAGAGLEMVVSGVAEMGLLRPWLLSAGVLGMPFTCSNQSVSQSLCFLGCWANLLQLSSLLTRHGPLLHTAWYTVCTFCIELAMRQLGVSGMHNMLAADNGPDFCCHSKPPQHLPLAGVAGGSTTTGLLTPAESVAAVVAVHAQR